MTEPTTSRVHYILESTLATVDKVEQTSCEFAQRAGFSGGWLKTGPAG